MPPVSQSILLYLGIAICVMVLVQLTCWTAGSIAMMRHNRQQFSLSRKLLLQQIEQTIEQRVASESLRSNAAVEDTATSVEISQRDSQGLNSHRWSGYRSFLVDRRVSECDGVTSIWLKPEDGKPLISFQPGQHLTVKLPISKLPRPIVRCYSLSSAPSASDIDAQGAYRITVKDITSGGAAAPASSGADEQSVSHFINQSLQFGDRVELKAPAGQFYLDESSDRPVVLLAGGIGITPMISMLHHIRAAGSDRTAILFYGVRNGREHALANELAELTDAMPNVHIVTCYSQPRPEDQADKDYQVHGRVTIELLQQILPGNAFDFYLCGPSPFMESLYDGLTQWQVPLDRIRFEAFGPATIGRKSAQSPDAPIANSVEAATPVSFVRSEKIATWKASHQSLLEMAEDNGIFPESGCRSGSCGSCETAIVSGKVSYDDQPPECQPGHCLMCIGKPDGPLELDV